MVYSAPAQAGGGAVVTADVVAGEALAAGDWVNIYESGGAARARKASAGSAGREAHGFVLDAAGSAATAVVHLAGINTAVVGQTPGPVWLSTGAGAGAAAAPGGAGQVVQRVGTAISATAVAFEPTVPITLA
jgi:hypothetical protein